MEEKYVLGSGVQKAHVAHHPPKSTTSTISSGRHWETKNVSSDFGIAFDFQAEQKSKGQSDETLSSADFQKAATLKIPSGIFNLNEISRLPPAPLNSYFCMGGDSPKVQIPNKVKPGQVPRRLAMERLRREYFHVDFEQLLADKGIDPNLLMPKEWNNTDIHETNSPNPGSPFLPLEIFDNEEYDCRTPQDWLALRTFEGSTDTKPIPAKALLPNVDSSSPDNRVSQSFEYSWHLVGVLDYSLEKRQYLVQKLTDKDGNPVNKQTEMDELCGATEYWIPRIRLLFRAEDPRVFAERLQFALNFRETTEAQLFYHLAIDCMPVCPAVPSISMEGLQRIKSMALSVPSLRCETLTRCIPELEVKVKLDYDCTMNRMAFDKLARNELKDILPFTLPQKESTLVPQEGCVPVPPYDYKKYQTAFKHNSLLVKAEVIKAISEIWWESRKVANMRLFNITFTKPLRLEEFEGAQTLALAQMHLFLRDAWMVKMTNCIRSNLLTVGKGTFDVNQSDWTLYRLSKMSKLLNLVRLNCQDTLCYLVMDSLASLAQLLLDGCHSLLTCPSDLVWGSDLFFSPYTPKKNPVFLVDLVLDQTGIHYSTPLEKFEATIDLFDKGVLATHKLPQLEKFVMCKLFTSGDAILESVNLWEPQVTELKERVRHALTKAVVPLRAYAAEFGKYLELHNLNIETFLKSHDSEKTFDEMKIEVQQHLKEAEDIELSMPSLITIGLFSVRVESVRQSLTKKKKSLANALLGWYGQKLRKQMDHICEEYTMINRKLNEKPNSIEELAAKKEWMKQIPEQLIKHKELFGTIMSDYNLIEEFSFTLTNEDVSKQWTAIGWPQRILVQMEKVASQHVTDEEHFREIHLADQNSFEEKLDALQAHIAGFANHTDIEHAHVLAKEVTRTSKQLMECQTLAQSYNVRERLLSMPLTKCSHLLKLMNEFQPFHDLWVTASDWLTRQDSWLNDPLSAIDPEQFERTITDSQNTMQRCIKQFKEMPDCQLAATAVSNKIEHFRPYIPLIQGLRNPGMRGRHWDMLSERIQIKVKPKATLTLSYCLDLGLQNYTDDIIQVSELAGKEHKIEQALEKMEQEWTTVIFNVLPYEETGTHILKNPDEVSQLLDHQIGLTQSLSSSPYKNTFEGRISSWDKKLRLTQDVLDKWLIVQRSWLYLEPIFSCGDVNKQQPEKVEKYKRVEKIWTSVMSDALHNPKVIDLCPQADLLMKLEECRCIFEEVQKGLSEYLEAKRGSFPR